MTTIMIIVVVALVFFATVSLSVFIVWKRETEMRTNSIRFIEDNLIEIRKGLTNTELLYRQELHNDRGRDKQESGQRCTGGDGSGAANSCGRQEKTDNQIYDTEAHNHREHFTADEDAYAEINLDFVGTYDENEQETEDDPPISNVGKSGKRYTISELETLIKE